MRRRTVIYALVGTTVGLGVAIGSGRQWYFAMRAERARNAMITVVAALNQYIRETGEWPRSWDDLESYSKKPVDGLSRIVSVKWDTSIAEILALDQPIPMESMPCVIRYAGEIPGMDNDDMAASERQWNEAVIGNILLNQRNGFGGNPGYRE